MKDKQATEPENRSRCGASIPNPGSWLQGIRVLEMSRHIQAKNKKIQSEPNQSTPVCNAKILGTLFCFAVISISCTSVGGGPAFNPLSLAPFQDPEFRQFICSDNPCTREFFETNLDYTRFPLRKSPPYQFGYFVTPKRLANNFYTAVFVESANPVFQFIFFGRGIQVSKEVDPSGYFYLSGTEFIDTHEKEEFWFKWEGKKYLPSLDPAIRM